MSWAPAAMQLPPSIAAVADAVGSVAGGAGADAAALAARLGSLTGTAFSPGALAGDAAAAVAARADFSAAMDGGGTFCVVHPFMHGVREPGTSGFYLSFPNAVKQLANKLLDANDQKRPTSAGTQALLALAISDNTLAGFAEKLQTFNAVFPVAQLVTAQRRANALLQQEQTRYHIPKAAMAPAFETMPWASLPVVRQVKNSVGQRLALAESYNAENTSPTDELAALLDEKQDHAASLVAAYSDLSAQFSGSPCSALYLTGTNNTQLQHSLLGATGGQGFDQALTAALMFVGEPAELVFLRELFGV